MESEAKSRIVELNIDLLDDLTGYGSSSKPTPAHHRIMKRYASPLLFGPPRSDLLLEMVTHMFTDDEADLVQHLPILRPRTVQKVASRSGRSHDDVGRVLNELAFTKRVILASGNPVKFTLLPIVPGTFEMALITTDLSAVTNWHKKFAEIFERLWDTGFLAQYPGAVKREPVRYLPVDPIAKTLYMAWPSDQLEQILEPYDLFSVGHCQCRMAMHLVGKGCGRSTENCLAIGPLAMPMIDRGMMRKIDRAEAIEVKRNAEREGSVTWMMNAVGDPWGNVSCSCCGCCCHGLRAIKELSVPGFISAPHFKPVEDSDNCTLCEQCVTSCPMEAWTIVGDRLSFNQARCIGCGLCVVACEFDALRLEPVETAKPPTQNWKQLLLSGTPNYLSNSLKVWIRRMFAG